MKRATQLASVLCWCLLCWTAAGAAPKKDPETIPFQSCLNSLFTVRFNDSGSSVPVTAQSCKSELAIKSVYLCLHEFCDSEVLDGQLVGLNESCEAAGVVSIPPYSIISNYTRKQIDKLSRVQLDEVTGPERIVSDVVLPSSELFQAWVDTLESVAYARKYHFYYGLAMIVFWVAVVGVGMMNRLVLGVRRYERTRRLCAGRRISPSSPGTWLRRKILVPATFGYRCATNVWWCTIPPRIQTITIGLFALINIAFSIHGYMIVPVNIYFPSAMHQILRYVSDRTGIISFANFPIIWLFGMRNNIAMWLTGWDFGTYNNFHRWVARIATLEAVIHSIGYTWLIFMNGGWEYFVSWWYRMFWIAGEIATVVMVALLVASVYWLRRQRYELFLILHIGMSVVVLVTMLGHVSIFNGEYDALFWIPLAIWVLDRLVRMGRIFVFNPSTKPTYGKATYNPSSNIVRLDIPCRVKKYNVAPGTFYYLSVIDDACFWESHPFTVATVADQAALGSKTLGEQVPLLDSDSNEDVEDAQGETAAKMSGVRNLSFLIRPYDSFTARLKSLAAADWPRPASLRVWVDGPYGHSQPLHLFDHVVFVVGGSGVVVPLSYLKVLMGDDRADKSVALHWAVREPEFAADVITNDIGDAIEEGNLSIDLYFSSETENAAIRNMPQEIGRHYCRPNVAKVILDAAERTGDASLAVVACGPARMADDARQAVVEAMNRGYSNIELFEESFRW